MGGQLNVRNVKDLWTPLGVVNMAFAVYAYFDDTLISPIALLLIINSFFVPV